MAIFQKGSSCILLQNWRRRKKLQRQPYQSIQYLKQNGIIISKHGKGFYIGPDVVKVKHIYIKLDLNNF
jgi:hypothetical protein